MPVPVPVWLPPWLRRDWARPRPTSGQVRADALLALGAAVVSVVNVELYRSAFGADLGWRGVEAYLWFAVAGLLLAGRRALPLLTLVLESAVFIVVGERMTMLGTSFPIQMILFATLYAAWAWSRRPRLLTACTAGVLAAMFGWLLWTLLQPGGLPTEDTGRLDPGVSAVIYSLAINVVYFFGAIAWGQTAWRSARGRRAAEQQVALELALAREQQERAVSDERVRIARDLHDVVAHHVSSIGIQAAGAERMLAVDPVAAREALGTIGTSSREAVSQMHQLVHLLRDPEEGRGQGRGPQPGLAEIAGLAGQPHHGPGGAALHVAHHEVGTAFTVPQTTALSLYRVTQEALTNVRRHAGARHASIVVRYLQEPLAVEVEVIDDGRGAAPSGRPTPSSEGGFGLAGIAERAELHGGESEIGPRPQGGFRVRVRIPVGAA